MISETLFFDNTVSPSLPEFINSRVQINIEVKTAIESICKREEFKKGQLLIKEGMVAHRLYFIEEGSARTYYHHDGKDVTSWVYREGQMLTTWTSFYTQIPSHENIELTETTRICSLTFDELQGLYLKYPKMQEFGRLMVEEQLVFIDYFYKGFVFMSAREKYDLLLSTFPDVTQRINLGHIASFLGISQETLSRIRKNK